MKTKNYFIVMVLTLASMILTACSSPVSAASFPKASVKIRPEEKPALFQCLAETTPGKTNRAEVVGVMGEPPNISIDKSGMETLEYPTSIQIIPITILIKQDIVQMVGKLTDNETQTISKLKIDLGEPEKITHSFFGQGTMTYLYPQKGFVAIVDDDSGQLLWVQCFIPMSLKDYLAGWGSQLPLEDPYIE